MRKATCVHAKWVCAVALVGLVCSGCRTAQDSGAATAAAQQARSARAVAKALWIWDARVITEEAEGDTFLTFCRERNIGLVFVEVGSVFVQPSLAARKVRVAPDELAQFASAVHAAGMKLHALDGDASWSRTDNHQTAVARLERALAFNQERRTAGERLDGFQFDVEPHALKGIRVGSEEWTEVLGQYLDLAQKLAHEVREEAPSFELGFAVPFWWDQENSKNSQVNWKGAVAPAAHHLIKALGSLEAAYIAIMAYRDQTGGPDGSIAHSENELSYADEHAPGVRIYIGQETADVAGEPAKITFWQEGEEALDKAVAELEGALRSHKTFAGVAIHHYDAYRQLAQRAEQAQPKPTFAITTPSEGDRVGRFTTVYGTASPTDAGKTVRVSVLPEGDIWYDQGSAKVAANGKWQVDCHIGSATTPSGYKFTIKADMDGDVAQIHVFKE